MAEPKGSALHFFWLPPAPHSVAVAAALHRRYDAKLTHDLPSRIRCLDPIVESVLA